MPEREFVPLDTLQEFRHRVDHLMTLRYGLNWADAAGDLDPLLRAINDGESPSEFVTRWATKYDLDPIQRQRDICPYCGDDGHAGKPCDHPQAVQDRWERAHDV